MITAHISGIELHLPSDFSFELVRQGQIPVKNEISGDYVPEISIPNTPQNRAILNHPERFSIQNSNVREYANFQLRSNGDLKISGTLVVREYNGAFEGYVRGTAGNLGVSQKQKNIRDYDFCKTEHTLNIKTTAYSDQVDEYCLPQFKNKNFFDDYGPTTKIIENGVEVEVTKMNRDFKTSRQCTVNKNISTASIPVDLYNMNVNSNVQVVSPTLFLVPFIKNALKEEGFFVNQNEFTTIPELQDICIYTNFDLNGGNGIETCDWLTLKLGVDLDFTSHVYVFEPSAIIESMLRQIGSFKYADLLPKTTLNELLYSFQNLFNFIISIDNNNQVSIIDRELVLSGESDDLDKYLTGTWQIGEKKSVTLKFSHEFDDTDSTTEQFVDLSDRVADFLPPVDDISLLAVYNYVRVGSLILVKNIGAIYEFVVVSIENRSTPGLNWFIGVWQYRSNYLTNVLYNLIVGQEIEEVKTLFSSLIADENGFPYAAQKGNSYTMNANREPYKPRLLFYQYFAGQHRCLSTGLDRSMSFGGEAGMIEKRWKRTADWWAHRQPVQCVMHIPEHILSSFNINKKKRTRDGEFIIEKMVTKYNHKGVGETQIEGYKA